MGVQTGGISILRRVDRWGFPPAGCYSDYKVTVQERKMERINFVVRPIFNTEKGIAAVREIVTFGRVR